MRSGVKSFLESLALAKVVLSFTICFSAPLSYGANEKDYRNLNLSIASVYRSNAWATGFFVTENLLVTNYHVVKHLNPLNDPSVYAEYVKVITPWRTDYGKTVLIDRKNDLAIIRTSRSDHQPLTLGSDRDIIRGQGSFTMGYPWGELDLIRQRSDTRFIEALPFLTYDKNEFLSSDLKENVKVVLAKGFIGMRIGNRLFHTTSFAEYGSSGSPVFSQDLKVIGVVVSGTEYTNSSQIIALAIHKLKTLIERNKELLQREGGFGLDRISPESVKSRAFEADVKTAEDMLIMGEIYHSRFHARNKQPNPQKARYWYEKAGKRGHLNAQYRLGKMYYTGEEGVERDYKKALEWFEAAAKQGHMNAQYHLGKMYYKGKGVRKDYKVALEWFEAAAKQGHKDAENRLDKIYSKVKGLKESFQKVQYWESRRDLLIKQCY